MFEPWQNVSPYRGCIHILLGGEGLPAYQGWKRSKLMGHLEGTVKALWLRLREFGDLVEFWAVEDSFIVFNQE